MIFNYLAIAVNGLIWVAKVPKEEVNFCFVLCTGGGTSPSHTLPLAMAYGHAIVIQKMYGLAKQKNLLAPAMAYGSEELHNSQSECKVFVVMHLVHGGARDTEV